MKKPKNYKRLLRYIIDDSINGFYANNFIKKYIKDTKVIDRDEFYYKISLCFSMYNVREAFKNYPETLDFFKILIESRLKINDTEPEKNSNEDIVLAEIFVTDEIFEPIYNYILEHDKYFEEYIYDLV